MPETPTLFPQSEVNSSARPEIPKVAESKSAGIWKTRHCLPWPSTEQVTWWLGWPRLTEPTYGISKLASLAKQACSWIHLSSAERPPFPQIPWLSLSAHQITWRYGVGKSGPTFTGVTAISQDRIGEEA